MQLFSRLLGDFVGQISLFTIAFIVVMAVYLFIWVKKQAAKDAENAGNE